jgi:CBS domain-containing protein
MKIREAMSEDVATVRPAGTARAVAQRMCKEGIGYFPVVERGLLVGVVTDRDIACRIVAEARDPGTAKIRDVMSKGVAYCFDDEEIEKAVQLMEQNQVRRLPVLNRKRKLVGLLSLSDVARHAPHRLTGEVLEAVSRETPLSVTLDPTASILR